VRCLGPRLPGGAEKKQGERAILADLDGEGVHISQIEEGQYLKQLEDMLIDLASALESSLDICNTLCAGREKFATFQNESNDLRNPHTNSLCADLVAEGLHEKITDLKHYRLQTESLRKKVKSAADLVASVLALDNGNALKSLAIESRAENSAMHELTERATRDAAAVKVLTVITLVYLPSTVVLNFFSTSFIHASSSGGGITVTNDWWICLVVSVPLTMLTLCIWRFYVQKQIHGHSPNWWISMSQIVGSVRRERQLGWQRNLESERWISSFQWGVELYSRIGCVTR